MRNLQKCIKGKNMILEQMNLSDFGWTTDDSMHAKVEYWDGGLTRLFPDAL